MQKYISKRGPWTLGDALSLLFPQRCPLCDKALPPFPRIRAPLPGPGEEDVWIHSACDPKALIIREPFCLRCGQALGETGAAPFCPSCRDRSFHFTQNQSLWRYEEPVRSAVIRFKYHSRQQYALYFARAWYGAKREYLQQISPQVMIPVPIHRSRLKARGYNQAALFAYALESLSGIPCREDLVIRSKHTGAQKDLSPAQRLSNMENAFRLKKPVEGIQRVLIVDDIYTTGSTLESISRLLREAGVQEVYGATLCMAGGEDPGQLR